MGAVLRSHLQNGLVMIVAHEEFLDAGSLQKCLVLLHLFGIGVFPFGVGVFGVEVVFFGRDEGGGELFLEEFFPWESFEPEMVFEILGSILAESVGRFT